jgi:hypothetical protein
MTPCDRKKTQRFSYASVVDAPTARSARTRARFEELSPVWTDDAEASA